MSSAAISQSSKAQRVLACVLCQHRKIKCDRHTPCSNCVKANVTCVPSTPAPARKRRRPNQDLQERLARCEELLKQYAHASGGAPPPAKQSAVKPSTASRSSLGTAVSPATTSPSSSSPSSRPPDLPATAPPTFDDPYMKWKPAGKVVVEDGSVHFMDSYLWSNVYDELQAMRQIVETEDPDESLDSPTPDDNIDLLLSEVASLNVEDMYPEPVQAFRLWQIFLDRVNPLTKVIHVPTLQPHVVESVSNLQNVPLSIQALLMSVFSMAVVALEDSECRQILNMSRDKALKHYSDAARAALQKTQFLRTYDMGTLQALVLYLLSLQGRYSRHGAWILSGLLIRIAQKMGLHRDGELLGLTPFETEMRRRLWWQIIMQDAKYAMLSGLSHSLLPWAWDTKVPSNINDADLFPGSVDAVQPREGPTEMAFCLFSYEIGKFLIHSQGFPGFEAVVLGNEIDHLNDPQFKNESVKKYRSMVGDLEKRLCYVQENFTDPKAGPIHIVCTHLRQNIIGKINSMLIPMAEQPEWGTEILEPKDNLFKLVLVSTEYGTEAYEIVKSHGFLWFTKMHFQVDVFFLMVGHLVNKLTGSLVDRAWKQVELVYQFHDELFDMSQKNNVMLGTVVLRAWRAREEALVIKGVGTQLPSCVMRLRDLVPGSESGTTDGTPSGSSDAASMTAAGLKAAARGDIQMTTDPALDQFLGGFFDVSGLDWDMWGDVIGVQGQGSGQQAPGGGQSGGSNSSQHEAVVSSFSFGGIGPSGKW